MKKCARDKPCVVRKPFGIVVIALYCSSINDTADSQPKYLRSFILIMVTKYGKIHSLMNS
jgi:hypothetical protein